MKRYNWSRIFFRLFLFLVLISVSSVLYLGGNYYSHLDRFSFYVRQQKPIEAQGELTKLKSNLAKCRDSIHKSISPAENWRKAGRISQLSADIKKFLSEPRKDPKKADAME